MNPPARSSGGARRLRHGPETVTEDLLLVGAHSFDQRPAFGARPAEGGGSTQSRPPRRRDQRQSDDRTASPHCRHTDAGNRTSCTPASSKRRGKRNERGAPDLSRKPPRTSEFRDRPPPDGEYPVDQARTPVDSTSGTGADVLGYPSARSAVSSIDPSVTTDPHPHVTPQRRGMPVDRFGKPGTR